MNDKIPTTLVDYKKKSVIIVVEKVIHICNTNFSWVNFDFTFPSSDSPSQDKMQVFWEGSSWNSSIQ